MTHAYDEIYLEAAMVNLGDAFEYISAISDISKDTFLQLFISTGIAEEFGNGNPVFLTGMSGSELAVTVIQKAGIRHNGSVLPGVLKKDSPYWCGWILAYYQWYSGKTFKDIRSYITVDELENLYPTLHEAPEQKFIDVMDKIISQNPRPTKLQTIRKNIKMTQHELSRISGVSLRSIQMYEQKKKDINSAHAISVYRLAKALGCKIEDLLEL